MKFTVQDARDLTNQALKGLENTLTEQIQAAAQEGQSKVIVCVAPDSFDTALRMLRNAGFVCQGVSQTEEKYDDILDIAMGPVTCKILINWEV